MSLTVEIENPANLKKARAIAGVKSNGKAIEAALEEYVSKREPKKARKKNADLPQSFWDDLFSQPMLPDNAGSQAVIDERNEARY